MLEAEGLAKTYRGKTVLAGVGFTLSPGECLGVAGHNGSGKSTLLSIVAQVTRPDGGTVRDGGQPVLGNRRWLQASLGYVPQQNSLLEDLTVRETLRFWQRSYGLEEQALFAPGAPAQFLGLAAIQGKRVGALSGGMQKRLSVALALLHRPRYLLLDEVLPAMDRHYRAALLAWLAEYRAAGGSILYCSHEAEELRNFCSSILVLRQGAVAYYGTAAAFPAGDAALDELMNPPPATGA